MTKLAQPNVLRTYQSGEQYAANELCLYNGAPAYTNTAIPNGATAAANNFTGLSSKEMRIIRVTTQTYTVTQSDADGNTALYIEYTDPGNPTITMPAGLTKPITIFNFSYPKNLNIIWSGSHPVGGMGPASPSVIFGFDGIRAYPYKFDTIQYYQVEWVNRTRYNAGIFTIHDGTDSTKNIQFNTSGIGTGQFRVITMPNADVNLGNVAQAASTSTTGYLTSTDWNTFNGKLGLADVRFAFVSDSGTTYTVPAYPVTAAGKTIIELSNSSLTNIIVATTTATGKTVGDSVNIRITGTFNAQVLVTGGGVVLEGDLVFYYQYQTKTLVLKNAVTNTWTVVG